MNRPLPPDDLTARLPRLLPLLETDGPAVTAARRRTMALYDAPRDHALVRQYLAETLPPGRVVLFGAGSHCRDLIPCIAARPGVRIVAIADNNAHTLQEMAGIPVIAPAELPSLDFDYVLPLHSEREADMIAELRALGLDEARIRRLYLSPAYRRMAAPAFLQRLHDDIDALGGTADIVIVSSVCSDQWGVVNQTALAEMMRGKRVVRLYMGREEKLNHDSPFPALYMGQSISALLAAIERLNPRLIYLQTSFQFDNQGIGPCLLHRFADIPLVYDLYDWVMTVPAAAIRAMQGFSDQRIGDCLISELYTARHALMLIGKNGGAEWQRCMDMLKAPYRLHYPMVGLGRGDPPPAPPATAGRMKKLLFAGSLARFPRGASGPLPPRELQIMELLQKVAAGGGVEIAAFNSGHGSRQQDADFQSYLDRFTGPPLIYRRAVDFADLLPMMAGYDFGLALVNEKLPEIFPYDIARVGLANRFMGYVEGGLPVVTSAVTRFQADMIADHDAGLVVEEGEIGTIARRIATLDTAKARRNMARLRASCIQHNQDNIQALLRIFSQL